MKYIKMFEDYFNEENGDYGIDIPKTSLNGVFYHGTTLTDGDFISNLEIGYSDYDAIWVSDDENISYEFSNWHYTQDEGVKLIFKIEIENDNIASLYGYVVEEIKEFYGVEDIRELIPYLVELGYDGWETLGSIDSITYNDIAIFDDDLIDTKSCKLKLDGEWTDYMSVNKAEELYNNWYEKKELI